MYYILINMSNVFVKQILFKNIQMCGGNLCMSMSVLLSSVPVQLRKATFRKRPINLSKEKTLKF
jgi:hypothetical protein